MRPMLQTAAIVVLLLVAVPAWAQSPAAVVGPVTATDAVRTTTQATSDAAKTVQPQPPKPDDEKK